MAQGRFLNAATATEPVAVLGAAAAQRLGIDRIYPGERIWVGGQWFYLAGILQPAVLAPEIDSAVLVGFPAAETYLGFDGHPSTIYVRARTDQVAAVQAVLAATANPEAPNEVDVSQPSDALVARAAAQSAFNSLFLGLGAVALLVGAVGVANIMVISVLERRSRDRPAPRPGGHPRATSAPSSSPRPSCSSLLGGVVGVGAGALATAIYASAKGWAVVIPAAGLGRRLRRRACDRRPGRPAAGVARCPPVAHRGAVERVMAAPLERRRPLTWGGLLQLVCRGGLAVVLLWSGLEKALDYPATLLAVHGYGLVPAFLERSVAAALPALEIALALFLLVGLRTRLGAAAAALLFALFLTVMAQALARGLANGCGCFAGSSRLSWLDLLRDLPLLAAALYLALRRDGPLRLDGVAVGGPAGAAGGADGPLRPPWLWRLRIAAPTAALAAIVAVAVAAPALSSGGAAGGTSGGGVQVAGPVRSAPIPAGSELPQFSAPALGGGQISWASYRGTPTVLIVWAPWCSDCAAELPRIVRAAEDFPAVKLTSIVTAVGEEAGPTPAAYVAAHHYSFPVALDSQSERLADVLGVEGFPTVYYVRADGVISRATVGAAPQHVIEALMRAIAG